MNSFHKPLIIRIIMGFILCTVIGTLSHEYGHILAARSLGYDTVLHYGSMNWSGGIKAEIDALNNAVGLDSTYLADKRSLLVSMYKRETILITVAGPLQTLIVSLIGLAYLILTRSKQWSYASWIALFLAFFSSRFVFNFITACVYGLVNGEIGFTGDEGKIAWLMEWPSFSISLSMFLVGLFICAYCTFICLPKKHLISFLSGGLVGGLLGFYLWMYLLGPMVLP